MSLDLSTIFTPGTVALYLDDVRTPRPNFYFKWVIVRSYQQFVNYIQQQGLPELISFDHDLADEHMVKGADCQWSADFPYHECQEKTGMDAAKWLVEWCLDNNLRMPYFTVHSANPGGAQNILSLLNNFQQHQGQTPTGVRTVW